MRVRDLPPEKLCDLCRTRIAALKTNDELTLLKALCGPCEDLVVADRPGGWESGESIDLATGRVIYRLPERGK